MICNFRLVATRMRRLQVREGVQVLLQVQLRHQGLVPLHGAKGPLRPAGARIRLPPGVGLPRRRWLRPRLPRQRAKQDPEEVSDGEGVRGGVAEPARLSLRPLLRHRRRERALRGRRTQEGRGEDEGDLPDGQASWVRILRLRTSFNYVMLQLLDARGGHDHSEGESQLQRCGQGGRRQGGSSSRRREPPGRRDPGLGGGV